MMTNFRRDILCIDRCSPHDLVQVVDLSLFGAHITNKPIVLSCRFGPKIHRPIIDDIGPIPETTPFHAFIFVQGHAPLTNVKLSKIKVLECATKGRQGKEVGPVSIRNCHLLGRIGVPDSPNVVKEYPIVSRVEAKPIAPLVLGL
jgi:hypothetical protein